MKWNIEFTKQADKDFSKLDGNVKKQVTKAIHKTAEHPLPPPEGIGKPLGNHSSSNLAGLCKIKLKSSGYRVVYKPIRVGKIMKIIIISIRDDETVYKEAEKRISQM